MRFFYVLNESNVKLRKSESYHLGRLENESLSNISYHQNNQPTSSSRSQPPYSLVGNSSHFKSQGQPDFWILLLFFHRTFSQSKSSNRPVVILGTMRFENTKRGSRATVVVLLPGASLCTGRLPALHIWDRCLVAAMCEVHA